MARRWRRRIARLALWAAALPVGLVALYAFIPPPTTALIVGERFRLGEVAREWRRLEDISPNLARAVIAAEDAKFCDHPGFDFAAIRTAIGRLGDDRPLHGASTISQQTAKNVFLWPTRSWARKALEVPFTALIELIWGKRRIIEVYLNVAELGEGAFGAQAAARRWFSRDADALTPLQAARLAAILPNPRGRDPARPSPAVEDRARRILHGMETVRAQRLDACVLD